MSLLSARFQAATPGEYENSYPPPQALGTFLWTQHKVQPAVRGVLSQRVGDKYTDPSTKERRLERELVEDRGGTAVGHNSGS